ncbi:MAG: InlB B-repeat-containing protein [Clostridia bacterium]|nr:InlB B-repeat-containing protein [Clostridia bacterium]
MKKIVKRIFTVAVASACCLALGLSACGSDDEGGDDTTETKSYTITFDYNYSGSTSTTKTVTEGGTVSKPTDPTRDGYTFDDWYTTSACTSGTEVDFTSKIYADATYYAGWTENVTTVEYTVTFVLYDSTTETQTVTSGDTATVPSDPERSGYVFSGWYSDSACTTSFDFSTEITADTSVYAGWTEVAEGYVAITYMWNYEGAGVYKVVTIEYNTRLTSLEAAARSGYIQKGWYTDADCTTEYVAGSGRVTENLTLYAKWYKGYTFEAEYTNLYDEYDEPREFQGYSNNLQGEQAVIEDNTGTASNGYYIGAACTKGCYLYFDIESDADITDAVLYLRLSFEYGYSTSSNTCFDGDSIGTVSLSSDQYLVTVNGTPVSYSTISFDVSSLGADEHIAFADFYINNITLAAGSNTIRLEVNNECKGEGGTQRAKCPLVDCMKIYSSTTLTWEPLTSNIK